MAETGTTNVKRGLAEMFKGGVIMDVTTVEQAQIAEQAGAVSVMALERIPADIRKEGGVARAADPGLRRADHERSVYPRHGKGSHRAHRRGTNTGIPWR